MTNLTMKLIRSVLVLALGLPVLARAEAAPAKGRPKAMKLEELVVDGHIQKPEAFYILPRSNLNYSALDQADSLLPRIKKAVKSDPF